MSDNLKAGITRACFHEPMVNRTYADLARHYRTAILPARPYRPKDKAKVEVGVQIVGRWILARLRNRRFFSLAALNEAIRGLLVDLNNRPLRSWGRSRRELFDELDRPALTPLPDQPYEYAEWKRCRVNLDYHVEIAKHYYSVPHNFLRQEVEARITEKTVEIFLRGKRVASHLRSTLPHRPTTIAEHMPSSHRRYRDWTDERIRCEAAEVGPDAETLIDVILRSRPHPEQGFRSAIGILGLVKRYGPERVDAACARALLLNARSYKSVAAILKNGTDRTAARRRRRPSSSTPTSVAAAITIDQEISMLIHPTVDRLRSLGLAAMADTLIELQNNPEAAEMSHADWLGLLIDREATFRDNRRLSRRLTAASSVRRPPSRTSTTVPHAGSIVLSSRPSRPANGCVTATTWPSSANRNREVLVSMCLGNKACRDGFSVLYKQLAPLRRSRQAAAKAVSPDDHAGAHQSHHH